MELNQIIQLKSNCLIFMLSNVNGKGFCWNNRPNGFNFWIPHKLFTNWTFGWVLCVFSAMLWLPFVVIIVWAVFMMWIMPVLVAGFLASYLPEFIVGFWRIISLFVHYFIGCGLFLWQQVCWLQILISIVDIYISVQFWNKLFFCVWKKQWFKSSGPFWWTTIWIRNYFVDWKTSFKTTT